MKECAYFGCIILLVLLWGFNLTSYMGAEQFLKREKSIKKAENNNIPPEIFQVVYLTTFQMVAGTVLQFFFCNFQVLVFTFYPFYILFFSGKKYFQSCSINLWSLS